jgi:hypothetical protein
MTIEIPIISTYKDKGAKQAKGSLDKLAGTAKKLGLALGLALSVQRVVAFGKASVAEFTASEKAAAALQSTLKNTGNLMAFPDAQTGIKNLAKLSGIADDSLMPMFSQLYRATGNVSQAMKDLNLAIDVSRGSSNELGSVVDALSKAYAGNTRGLNGLNLGLSKTFLASADILTIQKELNKTFGGASAAYLETYAGKVAVLNNEWSETKEIIGQGLVMAFEAATGDRGIAGMTKAMEDFGYTVDAVIIKLGVLTAKAPDLAEKLGLGFINVVLKKTVEGWSYLLGVDETRLAIQNEIWKLNTETILQATLNAQEQAKRNKEYLAFLAKQKRLADASAAAAKKRAAEEKKLADERKLLDQVGSLFNLEEIQIYAALQNKITDQEKLRLSLQLALIQENASEAGKLATELVKSQLQTTNLAEAIAKLPKALYPFEGWSTDIDNLIRQIELMKSLLSQLGTTTTGQGVNSPSRLPSIAAPFTKDGVEFAVINPQNKMSASELAKLQSKPATIAQSEAIMASMSYRMQAQAEAYNLSQGLNRDGTTIINVNGATQGLLDELRNGLINSSASGSFSSINPFR